MFADYPFYDSLASVVDDADIVVVGTLVRSEDVIQYPANLGDDPLANPQAGVGELSEEDRDIMGVPTTVSTVRVESSLKGHLKSGALIAISQDGGAMAGKQYREASTTLLGEAGVGRFVLAGSRYPNGKYGLVDPVLGLLLVSGETVRFAKPELVGHRSLGVSKLSDLPALVKESAR
jgi:hypothetical protein